MAMEEPEVLVAGEIPYFLPRVFKAVGFSPAAFISIKDLLIFLLRPDETFGNIML
jgi:hypothetical protein